MGASSVAASPAEAQTTILSRPQSRACQPRHRAKLSPASVPVQSSIQGHQKFLCWAAAGGRPCRRASFPASCCAMQSVRPSVSKAAAGTDWTAGSWLRWWPLHLTNCVCAQQVMAGLGRPGRGSTAVTSSFEAHSRLHQPDLHSRPEFVPHENVCRATGMCGHAQQRTAQ